MAYEPSSSAHKPCLDDLLSTMGITREQLTEMTADDLFAAAARWLGGTTDAPEGRHSLTTEQFLDADQFLEGLQGPPADAVWRN